MKDISVLFLSAGRRTKLAQYFKKEFKGQGEILAADCDCFAPALYEADLNFVIPKIDSPDYLKKVVKILKGHEVKGIFSLIDPEISLLSENHKIIKKNGTTPIVSPLETVDMCFDKWKMFLFLEKKGYNTPLTLLEINEFKEFFEKGKIKFPLIVKPRTGSASIGFQAVDNFTELEIVSKKGQDILIQEYVNGKEYGVDVYVDLVSQEIISVFIKEKIKMRSGETDKAVSVHKPQLDSIIRRFVKELGIIGPADIDIFEADGKFFISEVNPRFGGGYPLAYECGHNYPKYILNNLKGEENKPLGISDYRENVYMMKHDDVLIKEKL